MAQYVLIESRDPFEYGDSLYMYELAGDLAGKGNEVNLFLIQNGVLTARRGVRNNPLAGLMQRSPSLRVEADDFSLRERGISSNGLVEGGIRFQRGQLGRPAGKGWAKIVWH